MKKVCAHERKLNNGVLLKNPSKEKGKKVFTIGPFIGLSLILFTSFSSATLTDRYEM